MDHLGPDVAERGIVRVAIEPEELLPARRDHFADLDRVPRVRHPAAIDEAGRARPVLLVIGNSRIIDLDQFRAEPFEHGGCLAPERKDRVPCFDRLVGFRIGADIHTRHADGEALQGAGPGERRKIRRSDGLGAGQGDHVLRAPEIAGRLRVGNHDRIQQRQHVGDAARMRHDGVAQREERPVAPDGEQAARRRVGDEAVVRRRRAAGGDGLLAEPEGAKARRDGDAGPGGGARMPGGGEPVGIIGALRPAIDAALQPADRHGRHVGFAQHDSPGAPERRNRGGVIVRHERGKGGRTGRDRQALDLVAVLDRERDAGERSSRARAPRLVGCCGLLEDGRIEPAPVVARDAVEILRDEGNRRHPPLVERRSEGGKTRLVNVKRRLCTTRHDQPRCTFWNSSACRGAAEFDHGGGGGTRTLRCNRPIIRRSAPRSCASVAGGALPLQSGLEAGPFPYSARVMPWRLSLS